MLHVIAFITARPGRRAEVLAAFADNVANVRAEPGCLAYDATVDADAFGDLQAQIGPDSFLVVERWENGDALRAHLATPHMRAYAAATKELVASRTLHIVSPV